MALAPGTRLGPHEVLAKLGEGGMGEVYRATDTKLKREVAIKVLPASLAADADRLARFQREAEVLAALNHPHIAHIYGIEDAQGTTALVMELVEGPTLADRLAPGPIPVDEALPVARQLAEALEAAHEQGIVHRDLKPANIKVRPDGTVKVLDFGLAKAMDPAGPSSVAAANSPTLTARATQAGVILGTAAYMSPEQARGKSVDKRADNWAFGCVLFEMLTGRRPFEGETVTDVLAAVVTRDPDWMMLPAATPAPIRQLLARCLDRDPRTRLRDIGEARVVLANPRVAALESAPAATLPVARGLAWWWPALAAVALLTGLGVGRYLLVPAAAPAPSVEFNVTSPDLPIESGSFVLSPDGSRLALVVRAANGIRQLAIRDLGAIDLRLLADSTGAEYPFWSPDGSEVAYFARGQLFRVALSGATSRPVASVLDPRGGTWGPDDVILVGQRGGPILKVSAAGGASPEPVTTMEPAEESHVWPTFLPDGRRFVYLADASTDVGHQLCVASLDGGARTVLRTRVLSQPVVDQTGRLLVGERGQLLAYPFDPKRATLGSDPVLLATQVYPLGDQHHLPASASGGGIVAFQLGVAEMNLVMLDHGGRIVRTVGAADRYGNPRVSPNGKRVSFEIFTDTNERLVWAQDIERGVRTQISQRGAVADGSVWAPDDETVYFDSNASGRWELYRKPVSGGGTEALGAPESSMDGSLTDVSPDGKWLMMWVSVSGRAHDLFLRSTGGQDGAWLAWASGQASEDAATFSPDSRWVAYVSDASGQREAYIAPREGGPAARSWQISSGGASEPRFSPDGKTLYYLTPAFDWMAVSLTVTTEAVRAGTPKKLFTIPSAEMPYLKNLIEVLPDGSGFLNVRPVEQPSAGATRAIRVRTGK